MVTLNKFPNRHPGVCLAFAFMGNDLPSFPTRPTTHSMVAAFMVDVQNLFMAYIQYIFWVAVEKFKLDYQNRNKHGKQHGFCVTLT